MNCPSDNQLIMNNKDSLNAIFLYQNGELFYKIRTNGRLKSGTRAGSLMSRGYRKIMIKRKSYLEHRIIWMMFNGEIPDKMEVDHIDGNKLNNQIGNLRIATRTQNRMNIGPYNCNKLKMKGVSWHKQVKKWVARIRVDKKLIHLGVFDNPEDAFNKYKSASEYYHKEFSFYGK